MKSFYLYNHFIKKKDEYASEAALSRLKLPVRFPARDDSKGRIDIQCPRKMESLHLNLFSTFSTLVLGFPMKNEHPYLVTGFDTFA